MRVMSRVVVIMNHKGDLYNPCITNHEASGFWARFGAWRRVEERQKTSWKDRRENLESRKGSLGSRYLPYGYFSIGELNRDLNLETYPYEYINPQRKAEARAFASWVWALAPWRLEILESAWGP